MAQLKYFKRIEPFKEQKIQGVLPKPDVLLALSMPSIAIEAANSAVTEVLANNLIEEDSPSPCNKVMLTAVHGTYQVFTDKVKAELARRAAEHGITSIIRHFTKIEGAKSKGQRRTITTSTLHGWKVVVLVVLIPCFHSIIFEYCFLGEL